MATKLFNLVLFFVWASICLGLLTRHWWMPPALLEKCNPHHTPLVTAVTGILAAWNLVRLWIASRSRATGPSPVALQYSQKIRGKGEADPRITDPQFNFEAPKSEEPRS